MYDENDVLSICQKLADVLREKDRLREALEWYGDADNYIDLLDEDCGKRARDALAGGGE